MNSQEALTFINQLFQQQGKPILSEFEDALFRGMWDGDDYSIIAAKTGYSDQYVREAGTKLCKRITNELGIKVTKRNFKNPIKHRYNNPPQNPQQKPTTHPLLHPTENPKQKPTTHPLPNPFIPRNGRIENAQEFFNREREIRKIFEILNSNSSVVIIGEEGIGKSSLLWVICQAAATQLNSPRKPIFLDLNNGINNEDDFYHALCDEIDITQSKGYLFSKELKLKPDRILLAIDNIGKLTWQGFTRNIRDQLRGLTEGSNAPLRLILAATEHLDTLFNDSQDGGKTSPLAGICQEVILEPWNETIARNFINSRLATTSVQFTEAEINHLIQQSGGHPRRLMQLCYKRFSRYLDGDK